VGPLGEKVADESGFQSRPKACFGVAAQGERGDAEVADGQQLSRLGERGGGLLGQPIRVGGLAPPDLVAHQAQRVVHLCQVWEGRSGAGQIGQNGLAEAGDVVERRRFGFHLAQLVFGEHSEESLPHPSAGMRRGF
jgi:hypothetical protein